jgi:hypothetical protein
MVKHTMELEWKAHPIDLEALEEWLKETAGEHYCGNSADSKLKLHFLEEPSEEVKAAIEAKMEELDDEEHEMCKSYQSQKDRAEAKAKAKESAIKALAKASGLTKAQIDALLS